MPIVLYQASFLVPGNPEIEDCPAPSLKDRDRGIRLDAESVEVSTFTDRIPFYAGRRVAGVIGPIACDHCEHHCRDAYITYGDENAFKVLEQSGFPRRETPVEIRLLNETVQSLPEGDARQTMINEVAGLTDIEPLYVNQDGVLTFDADPSRS